jgi:hypothetical protein
MKKQHLFIFITFVFMVLDGGFLFSQDVPVNPTPEQIKAARARNEAFDDLERDSTNYYKFHGMDTKTVMVSGGKTRFFPAHYK